MGNVAPSIVTAATVRALPIWEPELPIRKAVLSQIGIDGAAECGVARQPPITTFIITFILNIRFYNLQPCPCYLHHFNFKKYL